MDFNSPALQQRRARVAAALELDDAILVIGAGEPVPLPETSDQTYPFRSHAEYFYVAGSECVGGVVAFDPRDRARSGDGWESFVPAVTEAERVWEGRRSRPGRPLSEMTAWLEARRPRPIVALGAVPAPIAAETDSARLAAARTAFTHARRSKDETELATLRRAVDATVAGFAAIADRIRPGVSERGLQIELEAAFCRGGADRTGYGTIVGSGPNAAVLHVEPSARVVHEGEFVLIDAGAEVERYTADVTRTYVAGAPSRFQRDLYAIVLAAQERAIARCVPGAEWKDVHLATAVDLTRGLVDLGVMQGDAATLVAEDAHTLFFPHGLGHMVGLGVRDASGLQPGRMRDPRASLQTLRMDLPLAAGYVVTVEPGLYFIPALLQDPARRTRWNRQVNWRLVDEQLEVGGVRIEDNLLVTSDGPVNLTHAISKRLA